MRKIRSPREGRRTADKLKSKSKGKDFKGKGDKKGKDKGKGKTDKDVCLKCGCKQRLVTVER